MNCTNCSTELGAKSQAAIAVMVAGDEVVHAYYHCPSCNVWSALHYHDHFMTGDVDTWTTGPYSSEVGERCIELIRACPEPQSKFCDCESHRLLYHGIPR